MIHIWLDMMPPSKTWWPRASQWRRFEPMWWFDNRSLAVKTEKGSWWRLRETSPMPERPSRQLCFLLIVTPDSQGKPITRGVIYRHACRWWHRGGDDYYMEVIGRLREKYSFGAFNIMEFDFCGIRYRQMEDGSTEMFQRRYVEQIDTNRTHPNFETSTQGTSSSCHRARAAVFETDLRFPAVCSSPGPARYLCQSWTSPIGNSKGMRWRFIGSQSSSFGGQSSSSNPFNRSYSPGKCRFLCFAWCFFWNKERGFISTGNHNFLPRMGPWSTIN